jgi:hypothetical protein
LKQIDPWLKPQYNCMDPAESDFPWKLPMTAGVVNSIRQLKCISKNRLKLIFVANGIEIKRNKGVSREP